MRMNEMHAGRMWTAERKRTALRDCRLGSWGAHCRGRWPESLSQWLGGGVENVVLPTDRASGDNARRRGDVISTWEDILLSPLYRSKILGSPEDHG